MEAVITPSRISGSVAAPQSKSLAIRLLFASLLGRIELEGLEPSDDVKAAIKSLRALGVTGDSGTWERTRNRLGEVHLDVAGSGTTLRMLIPVLSCLGVEAAIDGDQTLRRRPLGTLAGYLRNNGVEISGDHLPVRVKGRISTDTVEISGAESSQYISGFIYGLLLSGGGTVRILPPVRSRSYIEMTCAVLRGLGADVRFEGNMVDIPHQSEPLAYQGPVPGDFLLAGFYGIAAMLTGGSISLSGLVHPEWSRGDRRIMDIMERSGALVEYRGTSCKVSAGEDILPFEEDVLDSPDMAVNLAAIASSASGTSVISGIELLGSKESNRVRSILDTLRAFGVDANSDGVFRIAGTGIMRRGQVEDWNDHRISMLGTVLALRAGGTIKGPGSVGKSNPAFFRDIANLGGVIEFR